MTIHALIESTSDSRPLAQVLGGWRRSLHSTPETGFEEHRTSEFVAAQLRAMGYVV